jgi:DNA-binding MarR family transcriptional regulator
MHMHVKFVPNLTTTDLADALGIDQTTATRTLALLRKSGLVIDTPGGEMGVGSGSFCERGDP